MTDIKYQTLDDFAWLGTRYFNLRPEERLFLVGESFYDREKTLDKNNPSKFLVQKVIDGSFKGHSRAYFTRVSRWVSNESDQSKEGQKAFWNSVAFYHFVQTSVGDGPRQRPNPEQWNAGALLFKKMINESGPSHVIFFGKELWEHARDLGLVSEKSNLCGVVNDASHLLPAMATHHPSAFANKRKWPEEIREFLGPDFRNTFSAETRLADSIS